MHKLKKVLIGVAALAALAAGGATIADATSSRSDAPDAKLTGSDASRAGAAATAAVKGSKVVSVERSDEGGAAAYEVKVDKAGTFTEVQLDQGYSVLSTQLDDDQGAQDQGDDHADGESGDD